MTGGFAGAILIVVLVVGDVELDCARPGQARNPRARLRLAEIEGPRTSTAR